jgi:hypothetical protein
MYPTVQPYVSVGHRKQIFSIRKRSAGVQRSEGEGKACGAALGGAARHTVRLGRASGRVRAGEGPAQRRALAMGAGAEARLSQMDENGAADAAMLVAAMTTAAAAAAAVKGPTPLPAPSARVSAAEVSPTAASISASVASALIMQLGMPRVAPPKGASAAPTAAKKACTAGTSSFSDVLAQRSAGGDGPGSGSGEGVSSAQLAQMYVQCYPRRCLPACRPLSAGAFLPSMRSRVTPLALKRACVAACQP